MEEDNKYILTVDETGFLSSEAGPNQLVGVVVMLVEELAGMANVSYNEMLLDLVDPDDDVKVEVIVQGETNE